MAVATLVLTPKGNQKLDRVVVAVRQALQISLAREVIAMRALAAGFAPSPEMEAELLSRGVPGSRPGGARGGDGVTGGVVGTPEGGRFIRAGSQVPLREAILTDQLYQNTRANLVTVGTGHPSVINPRTGFFWRRRRGGWLGALEGPTEPFNHAYLQAVENGGLIWFVFPRPGTRSLEPEPNVFTQSMIKTMPPFQMYRRAVFARATTARQQIAASVHEAAREAGHG